MSACICRRATPPRIRAAVAKVGGLAAGSRGCLHEDASYVPATYSTRTVFVDTAEAKGNPCCPDDAGKMC